MEDSLLVGDFIVASKYSYGYSKYSLPFNIPIIPKRIFYRSPQRGDIALFRPPQDPYKHYIKRVIGLPGDKVQFRHGILYLNSIKVERELVNSYYKGDTLIREYKESLPNGKSYNILETNKNDIALNTPIYKVPENYFFMIGDNRNASKDSRFLNEVGYISSENLVGKARLILLSIDRKHTPFIRINRIFKFLN
jgi:signal peptidase I